MWVSLQERAKEMIITNRISHAVLLVQHEVSEMYTLRGFKTNCQEACGFMDANPSFYHINKCNLGFKDVS